MWKHAVVVLSLTLAGLAFGVSEVEACSCVIGSGAPAGLSREEQSEHYRRSYREHVRKQFGEAYAIFSAEAIAVGRDTVTFRLDDVWKGELPRELSMEAAPDPNVYPTALISSCDYFFKAGTRYRHLRVRFVCSDDEDETVHADGRTEVRLRRRRVRDEFDDGDPGRVGAGALEAEGVNVRQAVSLRGSDSHRRADRRAHRRPHPLVRPQRNAHIMSTR